MGVDDDSCQTRLVLGLGIRSSAENSKKSLSSSPSLTLTLFGETINKRVDVCSNDSAASSLSNASVKREREVGSEEVDETERVSSRGSDEDDDGSNGRKKLRLTKTQSALLEESFKHHSTLNPKQKQDLAMELKLRPRQVEVWFQNRRARTKLKQTEVECELLKKCCETLTDENRRLQKELHDLKLAPPLYMKLPAAATLTICPTCERFSSSGGGAAENATKSPFAKPHFYNHFTNPSAAC
nr:HD-Zip24 protein [Salvia miltiorrhiza]